MVLRSALIFATAMALAAALVLYASTSDAGTGMKVFGIAFLAAFIGWMVLMPIAMKIFGLKDSTARPSQSRTIVFEGPIEEAGKRALEALSWLAGQDRIVAKSRTWIAAEVRGSAASWGETVGIALAPLEGGRTEVTISSEPRMFQIFDFGKGEQNVDYIAATLSRR